MSRLVVDTIHFDLLRAHGGMQGTRDEDGLEPALARAQQHLVYEPSSDHAELAAAYGFGLARNHPFNDGNKRVAFVVMGAFLGLHGFEIEAPEAEVVTVMLDLDAGELSEDQLAAWIRSRLVASPDGTSG